MKPLVYFVPPDDSYLNDRLFDLKGFSGERSQMALLKERLTERYEIHTIDHYYRNRPKHVHRIFFLNLVPTSPHNNLLQEFGRDTLRLILFEPPVVNSYQYHTSKIRTFGKIYTWNRKLLSKPDHENVNFTVEPSLRTTPKRWEDRKFATLMAGNKISFHHQELYSDRYEYLRAAAAQAIPIDLYGPGWNKPHPMVPIVRSFFWQTMVNRRIHLPRNLAYYLRGRPRYDRYRGLSDDKISTLSEYRFVICLENQQGLPGYFTEKLWDCLLAGSVPVYLGASDVEQYVPSTAFIDARQYDSPESVLKALQNMNREQFEHIISAGQKFLDSKAFYEFTHERFCETIEVDLR